MPSLEVLLKTAIIAVQKACKVTRAVQQNLVIQSTTKADKSPVTIADYASQVIICHTLVSYLGEINMIAEEGSGELRRPESSALLASVTSASQIVWPEATDQLVLDTLDLGRSNTTPLQYWTLDPIDGTKGYLRGEQYAIALAYIVDGVVELGIMGCPNLSPDFNQPFNQPDSTGLIFYAAKGMGAWCLATDDIENQPLAVSAQTPSDEQPLRICESVDAGHSKHDDTAKVIEQLGCQVESARLDSQSKYAVVARGQADAYLRFPTRADYVENIWDHAAGMLIAEEAGMLVSDIHGKKLDYRHGVSGLVQNKGILCASQKYHSRIIQVIRNLGI